MKVFLEKMRSKNTVFSRVRQKGHKGCGKQATVTHIESATNILLAQ